MRIRFVAPERLRHEGVGTDADIFEALDEPRTPNIGILFCAFSNIRAEA
jgi:hypothetical protein